MIEVKDGNDVLQTNAYDGLTRRISSTKDSNTIHYYYNDQWRAVEEYPALVGTTTPDRQHLWGLRDRWDLVKRLRDAGGNLNEERYVLYDAMDPVAICDGSGTIMQRFEYSPFGTVSVPRLETQIQIHPDRRLSHSRPARHGLEFAGCRPIAPWIRAEPPRTVGPVRPASVSADWLQHGQNAIPAFG